MTLKNAISSNRIAHAYLFAGPRGVGKTTTARILAKALNCEKGPTPSPCNECTHCREITDGNSADVIEIDGASNRGIDEIRNLRENAKYVPSSSKYKIYIIDEIHMLTEFAFNALLKTLEEPPPHIIFIFATTQPHRIPQTILSRCQRYNFRKIGFDDITKVLSNIADKEDIKIEENALKLIARKADGALRDAEGMLDQLAAYTDTTIKEEDVRNVLGLPCEEVFFKMRSYIISGNIKNMLSLIQSTVESGISPEEILTGFIENLHSLLLSALGIIPEKEKVKNPLSPDTIIRTMRFLIEAKQKMRYSENPDIYLMETMARLSAFKAVPIEEIINRFVGVKEEKPLMITEEKEIYEEPDVEYITEVSEIWQKVVREVRKQSKSFASVIETIKPLKIDDESITVECPSNFHRDTLDEKRGLVEEYLQKIDGRKRKILLNKKAEDKYSPIMQKTLEIFSAEVISKGGRT